MDEQDIYDVIIVRTFSTMVTLVLCLFLIIVYIILCLQVKCNIFARRKTSISKGSRNSFIERSGLQKDMDKSEKKKIGLGSNYMFFLIFSNFIGEIFEFWFFFYYKQLREKNPSTIKEEMNNSKQCVLFGFAHNFFDILSICWTTMLSLLFYKSTNLTSEMLYKDTKYLLLGFAYSLGTCFICCVIPLWFKLYGYADTYCSFKIGEHSVILLVFKITTLVIILVNSFYNIFAFYKTTVYYSKKLEILKTQNKKEYSLVRNFVRVFQTFPTALVLIRLIKCANTFIVENYNNKEHRTLIKTFSYMNDISYSLNGAINSLACISFFRGVFWCCCSNNKHDEKTESLDINAGGGDVVLVENGNQLESSEDNNSINEMKDKDK